MDNMPLTSQSWRRRGKEEGRGRKRRGEERREEERGGEEREEEGGEVRVYKGRPKVYNLKK